MEGHKFPILKKLLSEASEQVCCNTWKKGTKTQVLQENENIASHTEKN